MDLVQPLPYSMCCSADDGDYGDDEDEEVGRRPPARKMYPALLFRSSSGARVISVLFKEAGDEESSIESREAGGEGRLTTTTHCHASRLPRLATSTVQVAVAKRIDQANCKASAGASCLPDHRYS
jgi:hypothetical protein